MRDIIITLTKKIARFLLLLAAIFIMGCIEEKSEYTINPDLSGKAIFELTFTPSQIRRSEPGDAPEQMIKTEIEQILRQSEGIDTWRDISFELTDEGSVHFTGTAYFTDINKLVLWRPQFTEINRFQFRKDESGRIIIELPHFTDSKTMSEAKDTEKLSEAELTQQVKLAKLRYKQAKPMLQAILDTLSQDSLLHLPAKIEKISNLEKVNETTVRWKIQGSEIIEAMDKMMADDEWLKRLIGEGKDPFEGTPDELIFNEMFFGEDEPVQAVISSDSRNLFDYDAEVAAARSDYDQMLKELKLVITPAEPVKTPVISSVSAEPGTVIVGGVRLVRHYDEKRDIRPLNWGEDYTLSLILELAEPNLLITHGRVEKALTDTGQSIVRVHRGISSPKLSKDGKAVVFDVRLSVPNEDAKGLAELSGVLVYLESTGTKKIDLGMMDFKEGTKSNVEGISIGSIRPAWDKEHTRMELKVNLLLGTYKSTKFYRENDTELELSDNANLFTDDGHVSFYLDDGTEFDISQSGKSFSGDRLMDLYYETKGEFPPRGRIVLDVLDNVTKHEIHFKLTNITLTGEPL